jgi:hypothetical protein
MSQGDLGFPQVAPKGAIWIRYPVGQYFACYELLIDGEPTDTWVKHCCHPTAIRPYYVHLATGMILARKFRLLAEAKQAAEEAHNDAGAV